MLARAGGKSVNVFEDTLDQLPHVEISTPRDRRVKPLVFKKLAQRIVRFRYAVREQQEPVARIEPHGPRSAIGRR